MKETGKFFQASQSQDSRQIAIAKAAISQIIPAANHKFHEALDDIEVEIVCAFLPNYRIPNLTVHQIRAKSVFERDLSSIRAKRAARERAAAGILRTTSPNVIAKKSPSNVSPKNKTANVDKPNGDHSKPKTNGTDGINITDVSMTEEPTAINGHKSPSPKLETSNDAIKTEPFTLPQSLPQDPSQPKGLAISLSQEPPTSIASTSVKRDPDINRPSTAQSSQPPLSATFPDAQFESMFNDTDLPTTTDDLDFDLNFSTEDATASTDLLDAPAFQNISLPNDSSTSNGQSNRNTTANEDLTALLPGLENYVNGSNDFPSLGNMPNLNTNFLNNNIPTSTAAPDGGNSAQQALAQTAPIESSFEDMFGLDSYMNGTGDDELGGAGGMGEVGDFDEEWFKGEGI